MNRWPVWARAGKNVAGCSTAQEVIERAGLDISLAKVPIYNYNNKEIKGFKAVCDRYGKTFGIVSDRYKLAQNRDVFSFFDKVVEFHGAKYRNAGPLSSGAFPPGAKLFVVADLPGKIIIGPDECRKILMLQSSHDTSWAIKISLLIFRVICSNGQIALMPGMSNTICVKHLGLVDSKLLKAESIVTVASNYFEAVDGAFNALQRRKFSKVDMRMLTAALLPPTKNKEGRMTVSTRRKNQREDIIRLFTEGDGHDKLGETRYAAYNAVTQYVDHRRSTVVRSGRHRQSAEFHSAMEGTGKRLKVQAFNLLMSDN